MRMVSVLAVLAAGCTVESSTGVGGLSESPGIDDGVADDSVVFDEAPAAAPGDGQLGNADVPDAPGPDLWIQSYIPTEVNGLALSENGMVAHVGMGDVSCDVSTLSGNISSDYYDDGFDQVVDVGFITPDYAEGFVTLTPGFVNVHPVDSGTTTDTHFLPGVQDVRVTFAGFVALRHDLGQCQVTWMDFYGTQQGTQMIDDGPCSGSFVADDDGIAWLATDLGVLRVHPSGVEVVDPTSRAELAYDGDVLYVGDADGIVRALGQDGEEIWNLDAGGPIEALVADEVSGRLFAAVDHFGRTIDMIDTLDGSVLASETTNASMKKMAVNGDGTILAASTHASVVFYRIQ